MRIASPGGFFRVVYAASLAGGLTACPPEDRPDLLKDAEALVLDQRYDEARKILKTHLLNHPKDAGAHYYLGRCYAESADFWPVVAEGEFQTALYHYKVSGDGESPIRRFKPDYFEMSCHLESAKLQIRRASVLLRNGVRLWQIQPMLKQARRYLNEAAKVRPNAPELDKISQWIDQFELDDKSAPNPGADE